MTVFMFKLRSNCYPLTPESLIGLHRDAFPPARTPILAPLTSRGIIPTNNHLLMPHFYGFNGQNCPDLRAKLRC